MKYFKIISTILFLNFLLLACTTIGNQKIRNETQETIDLNIIDHITTKDQVRKLYDTPNTTNFTDTGLEIWKYILVRKTAKGTNFIPVVNMFKAGVNMRKKELVILFDDNNIVKKHTFLNTKGEIINGIGG